MATPVDNVPTRRRKKGQGKGRAVDVNALMQVRDLLGNAERRNDLLIEFLHLIQDKYGYLSSAHLVALAHDMKMAPTEVYEVATFYHHFDVVKDEAAVPAAITVRVCDSVSCELNGANELIKQLESTLGNSVRVQPVPCIGRCAEAPAAVVGFNTVDRATAETVTQAVNSGKLVPDNPQSHISFEQYKEQGGYQTALSVHSGKPAKADIIQLMKDGGLRGLGGAGFPAGLKWEIVSTQPGPRYMAVNIDEGEPGTFKDRYYIEKDPHRFFEGMLIAASVVDIDKIWVYTRDEYALGRQILEQELAKLLIDAPYDLPQIELRRGAGAYICGEESAMIESIEGKRGLPRHRPPFVAQVGLFGRPTLEHNFETLYWVRDFIEKGHEWFTQEGRNDRVGLRSFSVSGRVKNPGVHLAPAGITMVELIEEYCGGMLDNHTFYAYFPGGASGGILPASLGNIPLDFDTLQEYDCFIGSAAIVVLSDKDSARQAACGLGQAAPNPLRSVIKHFAHEINQESSS